MPQRVVVSYSGTPAFIQSDQWKQLHTALQAQLPLRTLHWKSAIRPSLRTIQELDIDLVSLESVRDEVSSQIPTTLLERPLLNIYIVICEDNEAYKAGIRKQIKDWHTLVTQRKNQEWLIVQLSRPDARALASGFFQVKTSVLDKIKADFNSDKRDRCVQLAWALDQDDPTAWADLIGKIKEGVISAFESAVAQRDEEIKRSENQRAMPGWNFCTFFILKESLASSFEGVNLYEDALLTYDELEIAFYLVLREKNLSWFGTLISPAPKDDTLPLLSTTKKPYRDLILANTISVFDFRVYLLARQCILLGKMGKVVQVAQKVVSFIGAFGRRLREVQKELPGYFVESWSYSSALSVVEQCDVWAAEFELEAPLSNHFNASKGELLELARKQLDIVGVAAGHLPRRPPFSLAWPSAYTSRQSSAKKRFSKSSDLPFLVSIVDQDSFYELYVAITNRAIEMYTKSGRKKFALRMYGDIAALDLHRGRLTPALQTYSSLPAHYAPHKWTSLQSFMLSCAVNTHAALEKPNDREWIHTILTFLDLWVEGMGKELLMMEDDKVAHITNLVRELVEAAGKIESDVNYPEHAALRVRPTGTDARISETEDGSFVDVVVQNRLPCEILLGQIDVVLAGRETEKLRYSASDVIATPGVTAATLFCPASSSGTYILESVEVRISHLVIQWNHRKIASSLKAGKIGHHEPPTLIKIPKDLGGLDVLLHQPRQMELGAPSKLIVVLSTGRNKVKSAMIKLSPPPGVRVIVRKAALVEEQEDGLASLKIGDDSITLEDAEKDSKISVAIPHTDASSFQAINVSVDVEYVVASQPTITRTLKLLRLVQTSLPVNVNVQDFFRGSSLFSRFTISTTSQAYLRIQSANLEVQGALGDGEVVQVTGCRPRARAVMTVTPARPANFLYQITSPGGPVRETLRLRVMYRMLQDEIEELVSRAISGVCSTTATSAQHRYELNKRVLETLEQDPSWKDTYIITGELKLEDLAQSADQLEDEFRSVQEVLAKPVQDPFGGEWREIAIPVDVPHMNILAAVRLSVLSTPFSKERSYKLPPLYAGQPISATLSIETSFHWGTTSRSEGQSFMMRFDVQEMVREWLVSGRKRGDFEATDGGVYTVPITLIALHHGELALPTIAITPLPIAGEYTMGSMVLPSAETYQKHGAEKVLILPRGGRSTFVVGLGS